MRLLSGDECDRLGEWLLGDRTPHASGRELRHQLVMAEIDGALSASERAEPRRLLECELGLLWRLTRRRR